jgi:hypothetical protein
MEEIAEVRGWKNKLVGWVDPNGKYAYGEQKNLAQFEPESFTGTHGL